MNDCDYAYMIWGLDDETHEIVGTKVRLQIEKKGEQELENRLRYLLSKNADFEFYETEIDGKHVELMRIHKALNEPVAFLKVDYIRSGSYTKKLHEFPVFCAQLWSCYLHACLMYIQGDALTNKSLRDRFNEKETSAGSISRLIKESVTEGRIKALEPDTAKRCMKYIPGWA